MAAAVQQSIDTVIFDVGWVLVHVDFQPLLKCINATGQRYTAKEVIAAIDLEAHECGRLDTASLLRNLHGLAPHAEPVTLRSAWIHMLTPIEPMWKLVQSLRATHRVYLLSNVGELHWLHLHHQYDLRALAHDLLPSFEAGVMKPDSDIYRQAERRFQLEPKRTVFIDDLEPNVAAARARGWHAITHQSPEQTRESLCTLGVEV